MKKESNSTNIVEIFSSIQGEGPYIGFRQIFVRFSQCNLTCDYCDTDFQAKEYCKVEARAGSGMFKNIKNPVTIEQLIHKVEELSCFNHHSISLTGGEPLLGDEYIYNFLDMLKKTTKIKVYLETNGTLTNQLEKIIEFVDIVSMDFKLESSTKILTPWDKHNEFIKISQAHNKEIFAKVAITKNITTNELEKTVEIIKTQRSEIPVIIQPVESEDLKIIPDPAFLMKTQEYLLKKITDVRIIPQTHKYLEVL